MKLKRHVAIDKLSLAVWDKLPVIERCFHAYDSLLVLTSGHEGALGDGVHGTNSYHYIENGAQAIDCRTRHLNLKTILKINSLIREKLGPQWDVIFEGNHTHIELNNYRR